MTKHNHNHSCKCEHSSVKFCSHCNTVYCQDCNQEWSPKGFSYWHWNNPTTQPWYSTVTSGGIGQVASPQANLQAQLNSPNPETTCSHNG